MFSEYIELPIIFNEYDLALYQEDDNEEIIVIGKLPSRELDSLDFSDASYLAYPIDFKEELTKEKLFNLHFHPHICNLTRFDKQKLNDLQKDNYEKLVKILKDYFK